MTIIDDIVNRFPDYYHYYCKSYDISVLDMTALNRIILEELRVQEAFYQRCSSSFRKEYASYTLGQFDFILVTPWLKKYLRKNFKNAEILCLEMFKASSLSIEQVKGIVQKAHSTNEFQRLISEETEMSIWSTLENSLRDAQCL